VRLLGNVRFVSDVAPENASYSILVKLLDNVSVVSEEASLKALSPIKVRLLGKVRVVSEEASTNAYASILVRLLGRVRLVSRAPPSYASSLMDKMPSGITTEVQLLAIVETVVPEIVSPPSPGPLQSLTA
jgi:hypothetical protein